MSDVLDAPVSSAAEPSRRPRVAPFVVLAVAIAVAALFVVLARSGAAEDEEVSSYLIGRPAPTSVGTTLDGDAFDLGRRKGSWVVLNFFDPACVPCVQEHPELIALHQQQLATVDGAELYTIINRGSDEDVAAFFDERGGGWPVVSDPDGSISAAFGVAQVPETWVIDPNGIVRARYAGTVTAGGVSALLQQMREGAVR